MSLVSKKYHERRCPWNALTLWDRFKHRHKRNLGMQPILIIHQGQYVIKGWHVPCYSDDPNYPWGEMHRYYGKDDIRDPS